MSNKGQLSNNVHRSRSVLSLVMSCRIIVVGATMHMNQWMTASNHDIIIYYLLVSNNNEMKNIHEHLQGVKMGS